VKKEVVMEAKTVLVVNDNALVLQIVADILSESGYGYYVTTAECGEEALAICRYGDGFDLVLTDLKMGKRKMDGIELANAVASFLEKPPIVVLMTAVLGTTREEAGPNVSAILEKPFSLERFLNVLENVQKR
jgi:CheY-like chemotaxis protein